MFCKRDKTLIYTKSTSHIYVMLYKIKRTVADLLLITANHIGYNKLYKCINDYFLVCRFTFVDSYLDRRMTYSSTLFYLHTGNLKVEIKIMYDNKSFVKEPIIRASCQYFMV